MSAQLNHCSQATEDVSKTLYTIKLMLFGEGGPSTCSL